MRRVVSPFQDRELVELLEGEPELLAIADALVATSQSSARTRRIRPVLRAALAVAAAALAGGLLALYWPSASSPSVLDQALAAIGSRPVTHIVLEDNLGGFFIDLGSGRRTAASGRQELWYQPSRGLLWRLTFPGQRPRTFFSPSDTAPGLSSYISQFVRGYRAQLRNHTFHLSGRGTVDGTPVYWISSRPLQIGQSKQVDQVAISRSTFKPVYFRSLMNGKLIASSAQKVLTVETIGTAPSRAGAPKPPTVIYGWLNYVKIPLSQARSTRPSPLIPSKIAGLHLTWTGRSPFSAGNPGSPIAGVCLYYSTAHASGAPTNSQPAFRSQYIEIVEFPRPNAITRWYTGRFPSQGTALVGGLRPLGPIVDQLPARVATLQTQGHYVLIQASTNQLAIAAARAISR